MPQPQARRRELLDGAMRAAEVDAYLCSTPANVYYFSRSEEAVGTLLLVAGEPARLLVRSPGYEHARASVAATEVERLDLTEPLAPRLARYLTGARTVAYDDIPGALLIGLQAELPAARIISNPGLALGLRRYKDPEEEQLIRTAVRMTEQAMTAGLQALRTGISELELAAEIEATIRRLGGTHTLWLRLGSGPRGAYCDADPRDRVLRRGDLGFIDIGAVWEYYFGDLTRSFCLGDPTAEQRRVGRAVEEALVVGLEGVRPGVRAADLYAAAYGVLERAGLAHYFPHHLGHGMGLTPEPPALVPGSADVLEEGDIITLEPGVYIPGFGGMRMEEVLRVTGSGHELISCLSREWIFGR